MFTFGTASGVGVHSRSTVAAASPLGGVFPLSLIVVTGTTGHLGRLMMERLLIRAIACGQCVVRAGPNRGRCLEECSII
jgi:hypothetical protein